MLQIKKIYFPSTLKQLPAISGLCRSIYQNRGGKSPYVHPNPLVQPIPTRRKFRKRHINPKFRLERSQKVMKVDLPDFHEKKMEDMSPEEMRTKMKEMGIQPFRPWNEKPIFISSTSAVFEPYIPPEGDGKASVASKEGLKQNFEFFGKKGRSYLAVRKIRQFDDEFEYPDFIQEATNTYIKLHEALAKLDEDEMHKLATEKAFPLLMLGAKHKTIRWTYHGAIEPPRVVLVRQTYVLTKDNIFAQITVRFHTQQTLAVYDRFGRILHGSESVLRDVLEYVVFEKHISNTYGAWRIHDKIVPEWMELKPSSHLTFKVPVDTEPVEGQEQPATTEGQIQQTQS